MPLHSFSNFYSFPFCFQWNTLQISSLIKASNSFLPLCRWIYNSWLLFGVQTLHHSPPTSLSDSWICSLIGSSCGDIERSSSILICFLQDIAWVCGQSPSSHVLWPSDFLGSVHCFCMESTGSCYFFSVFLASHIFCCVPNVSQYSLHTKFLWLELMGAALQNLGKCAQAAE